TRRAQRRLSRRIRSGPPAEPGGKKGTAGSGSDSLELFAFPRGLLWDSGLPVEEPPWEEPRRRRHRPALVSRLARGLPGDSLPSTPFLPLPTRNGRRRRLLDSSGGGTGAPEGRAPGDFGSTAPR
ncbi:hypothetical protein JRQ81_020086, partial [Phrynocephalus forsythii]